MLFPIWLFLFLKFKWYFMYILTFFISLCSERQMKCNRAGWRWSRGAVTRGTDSVYFFGFPNATGPRLNAETIFRNFGYVLIARWLRIWDQQTLLSILVSNEYHVRKNLNVSAIDYIIKYVCIFAQKFGTYHAVLISICYFIRSS